MIRCHFVLPRARLRSCVTTIVDITVIFCLAVLHIAENVLLVFNSLAKDFL